MTHGDIEMPIYTESTELGEKGTRMLCDVVEDEFHWIFRPKRKNDIGIDGEIEIINDARRGTGKLIAVQVKCGESYFEEKNDEGFIFRPRIATVNYWLSLSIPVIVCICNPTTKQILWCHITVESVKKRKKGYKVVVPFANTFNIENKNRIEGISDSVVQLNEIVDAALFKYLYERYKHSILICPLAEEPRDFHNLSYIAKLNGELYIIGTVIDKYGYIELTDLTEKIRLYHENRHSCGWEQSDTKSRFLICFVSESKDNLILTDDIVGILNKNADDVEYSRFHLSKSLIMLTLLDSSDNYVYFFDDKGHKC